MPGLCNVKEKDLPLCTASEEATGSRVKDGAIGDSFLGWIKDFSKKTNDAKFSPDGFLKLSKSGNVFTKQKIESIGVEKVAGNDLLFHLAADYEGRNRPFKI